MNRFFFKVNGELHCPGVIARPQELDNNFFRLRLWQMPELLEAWAPMTGVPE